MKENQITEENIQQLVDTFYEKIREDKALSPIFLQAIGDDLKKWKSHMQTMYDFWSAIMLNSRRYSGNPLQKHRELPSFDRSLFDRWLDLFKKTAFQIYTDEIANHFIAKSNRIAESLKLGLYDMIKMSDSQVTTREK